MDFYIKTYCYRDLYTITNLSMPEANKKSNIELLYLSKSQSNALKDSKAFEQLGSKTIFFNNQYTQKWKKKCQKQKLFYTNFYGFTAIKIYGCSLFRSFGTEKYKQKFCKEQF